MTDVLTPLIEAYRAENAATALDARALRTRVLQASARRRQSPLRHAKWLLPIAATFIVTGALAATPVARPLLTNLLAHLTAFTATTAAPHSARRAPLPPPAPALTLAPHPDLPNSPALLAPRSSGAAPDAFPSAPTLPSHPATDPAPSSRASSGASRTPHASPTSDSSSVSNAAPSSAVASSAHSASAHSASAHSASAHSAAGVPPPPAPPPVVPLTPDLNAYSVAHRLHFTNGDYAGALTAWNGYLARFPNGTFAPEARLNRAVCLARLGRTQEARTQLQAIAKDRMGSYGAQARRLLGAMDSR
jgi:hypothetical protein